MPSPEEIIDRMRSYGARPILNGTKFEIVNANRLPPDAAKFIRAHTKAIYTYLLSVAQDEYEERAAILQYEGGLPRPAAEAVAWSMVRALPPGLSDTDRDKRIIIMGRIADEVIAPAWGVAA